MAIGNISRRPRVNAEFSPALVPTGHRSAGITHDSTLHRLASRLPFLSVLR